VFLSSASNEYVRAVLETRCDQVKLIEGLRTLLGLFYQPSETDEERARQIAMFVADLSDMSDDCVWWAMREWRRNNDRRPSPASLRQLAMMRRQEALKQNPYPKPVPALPYREARPETVEERKAVVQRAAASCGFVRDTHGQLAFPEDVKRPVRVPHWSETAAPDDPRWAELRRARAASPLTAPEPAQ
jgi:hypothetical protein